MSRPLICDNPGCETIIDADTLADIAEEREGNRDASTIPEGWVTVSEVDGKGEDVVVGECCSRECAATLLTISNPDDA